MARIGAYFAETASSQRQRRRARVLQRTLTETISQKRGIANSPTGTRTLQASRTSIGLCDGTVGYRAGRSRASQGMSPLDWGVGGMRCRSEAFQSPLLWVVVGGDVMGRRSGRGSPRVGWEGGIYNCAGLGFFASCGGERGGR